MTLKIAVKAISLIRQHWVNEWIEKIMYHHTKYEFPSASYKKCINVQSCARSLPSILCNATRFRHTNPQNCNFHKIRQKKGSNVHLFAYYCISHFIIRQKKSNKTNQKKSNKTNQKKSNKTNKYRRHFRSKPHQTTSLMGKILDRCNYHSAGIIKIKLVKWYRYNAFYLDTFLQRLCTLKKETVLGPSRI